MENLNNVPSTGTFGGSINQVNQNFGLVKDAIENVEGRTIRSKGLFPTQAALIAAYPSPKVGDYAYVGSSLPATTYDCEVEGTWHNTQQQGGSESVPLNNYPTKSEMNAAIAAIEIETVDNLNEETAASGKALDAHQGFVLSGQIGEQEQELANLTERLTKTESSIITFNGTTKYNSHDLALPKGKLTVQIIVPEGDTAVQPAGATAGFEIQIPVGTQKLKLTQKQFAQLTLPQTYTYKYTSDGTSKLRIYERVKGNCTVVVSGIEKIDSTSISYSNALTSEDNVDGALNDIYNKVAEIPSSLTKREYIGNKIDIKKHKYSAQQYADITSFDAAHAVQGGCNWGKYLFIGISGGTTYYVIDLEAKTSLGSFNVDTPSIQDTHCNSMVFSNKYWQDGDEFPIMYASSGYGVVENDIKTFCAYGYRIIRNENVFSATLVHTINIQKTSCAWTEFVIDNDNNRAWIKCEVGGNSEWYSLAMPNPSNGDTTINLDEIEKAFTLPFNYIGSAQNHLFYNGRIFFTSDTGNTGAQHYIYVVNPYSGGYDSIVNISAIYDRETEQLFIYNNNIYVRYRTGQYTRNVYYKYYFE